MSILIQSFDKVHDTIVLSCSADFEARTLYILTKTEDGQRVSISFTGLMAHFFENVILDNILSGMDEITTDGFFKKYSALLNRSMPYGFPASLSIEDLQKRMEHEHIRVFVIDSSLGLCGFVLALEVKVQCL